MKSFLIQGDVGQLEVLLDLPKQEQPNFVAVVCHPHPLFEGTMHNKVAYMLSRSLTLLGGVVLRFNFRGVGESAGEHDDGIGEVGDVYAAMQYISGSYPNLPMVLAGFSFGSYVALRCVQNTEWCEKFDITSLVTAAPPVGRWDFSDIKPPQMPYLIIQGDKDDLVDVDVVSEWSEKLEPQPKLHIVNDADHFFHGKLTELKKALTEWMHEIDTIDTQ